MDAILGITMPELLERVSVEREIKAELLGQPNGPRTVLELARAQENPDWEKWSELARELHMGELEVEQAYLEAVHWASEVVGVPADRPV